MEEYRTKDLRSIATRASRWMSPVAWAREKRAVRRGKEASVASRYAIAAEVAPALSPKLYYSQPGYARNGKVVVFFRSGGMDKTRYSTFGVSPEASLDDDSGFWPTSYALIDPSDEAWGRVREVVRRAAG